MRMQPPVGAALAALLVALGSGAAAPPGDAGATAAETPEAAAPRGRPDTVTCDGRGKPPPVDAEGTTTPAPAAEDGQAAGDDRPEGEELMRRAAAVYDTLRTLRAGFHQTIEMRVFDPPRRSEGSGTWYQRRPSRFRMDFSDPEDDLIVSDGRHLWLYYPSTHPGQVIRSELDSGGRGAAMVDLQGRIFQLARTRYDVRYAGRDTLGGAPVHRVEMQPRSGEADYRRVGVWLDAESLLVRRLVFEDRSETVRTVTLERIRTGVSLPDSLFRFEVPADAEVFEG